MVVCILCIQTAGLPYLQFLSVRSSRVCIMVALLTASFVSLQSESVICDRRRGRGGGRGCIPLNALPSRRPYGNICTPSRFPYTSSAIVIVIIRSASSLSIVSNYFFMLKGSRARWATCTHQHDARSAIKFGALSAGSHHASRRVDSYPAQRRRRRAIFFALKPELVKRADPLARQRLLFGHGSLKRGRECAIRASSLLDIHYSSLNEVSRIQFMVFVKKPLN